MLNFVKCSFFIYWDDHMIFILHFVNVVRVCAQLIQSCLTLCDPTDVAHQAPPFMGFSRQEYWSGLPCPSPRELHNSGIEPLSPEASTLQAECLLLSH